MGWQLLNMGANNFSQIGTYRKNITFNEGPPRVRHSNGGGGTGPLWSRPVYRVYLLHDANRSSSVKNSIMALYGGCTAVKLYGLRMYSVAAMHTSIYKNSFCWKNTKCTTLINTSSLSLAVHAKITLKSSAEPVISENETFCCSSLKHSQK